MVEVSRYIPSQAAEWNEFVARSKNGTFLFDRRYMDYHADRFSDHSLIFRRKGKLVALLPANVKAHTLYSHQGLTYGGLVMGASVTTNEVADIFRSMNACLASDGIEKVVYRAVPHIYHSTPAEEDLYALFHVCGARLTSRQAATVVSTPRLRFAESRRSGLRKALRSSLTVGRSSDADTFWKILNDNLQQKYHSKPVHSAEEMRLLMSRFPNQIKLYLVEKDGEPLGGTIVYETSQVVHTQYISATKEGKAAGAIDLLFDHLLHREYADVPYFDFGTSLTSDGQLNPRLLFQKEGFGGRAVCYDTYAWNL
ncbi:MAG: GNAT family N-acetyltransferase [Prevotella sp.]|nr:GNAT family N-acetyltransferase [Prevotella sp.]